MVDKATHAFKLYIVYMYSSTRMYNTGIKKKVLKVIKWAKVVQ